MGMIDLNKPQQAQEHKSGFEMVPKGDYKAYIIEIGDWKPKVNPSLKVLQFDEKFRKVKTADNKDAFTMETNFTTYSAMVKYEILEGEFAGNIIFDFVNLHPNMPWNYPAFLHAVGLQELAPANIQDALGSEVVLSVDIEEKPFNKTDPETGLVTTETKPRNVVRSLKAAA